MWRYSAKELNCILNFLIMNLVTVYGMKNKTDKNPKTPIEYSNTL
jgi:hypothetical protein